MAGSTRAAGSLESGDPRHENSKTTSRFSPTAHTNTTMRKQQQPCSVTSSSDLTSSVSSFVRLSCRSLWFRFALWVEPCCLVYLGELMGVGMKSAVLGLEMFENENRESQSGHTGCSLWPGCICKMPLFIFRGRRESFFGQEYPLTQDWIGVCLQCPRGQVCTPRYCQREVISRIGSNLIARCDGNRHTREIRSNTYHTLNRGDVHVFLHER